MEPTTAASHLRRIATALDNSKNPDPSRVSAELRKLVAAISDPEAPAAPVAKTAAAPSDIASELRGIADKLARTKNPDRAKVASAIKAVFDKVSG